MLLLFQFAEVSLQTRPVSIYRKVKGDAQVVDWPVVVLNLRTKIALPGMGIPRAIDEPVHSLWCAWCIHKVPENLAVDQIRSGCPPRGTISV